MARGTTGLASAWVCSCTPLVLPAISSDLALALGDASRLALAALPWIAWLGLPLRRREPAESRGAGPWATVALSAPPIAAGLGLDLARGGDPRWLATLACAALAMILALAFAADLAARARARSRAHAAAWLAIVPGAPLLAACLALAGAPTYGEPSRWLAAIAAASPLGWIAARAPPSAGGEPLLAGALAALGVCLVLLAIAGVGAGAASGERRT